MVQALSPNRTNDALNIRPLPRGSRGGKDFLDSHVGYLSVEVTAVDAGCTPTRILAAHSADEMSDLAGNRGSSCLAKSDFPSPEETKALAMPGNDGLGLNDSQRGAPVAPDGEQPDPQQTVQRSQPGPLSHGTLQHADLVPQGQVLQLKGSA